jgi:hypothetical protein
MGRPTTFAFLFAALLFSSSAFAQNVANTSQHGSMLIFPLIDIRAENKATTQMAISNDENVQTQVECNYVNQ